MNSTQIIVQGGQVRQVITDLPENSHIFEIVDFDNTAMPVVETAYGSMASMEEISADYIDNKNTGIDFVKVVKRDFQVLSFNELAAWLLLNHFTRVPGGFDCINGIYDGWFIPTEILNFADARISDEEFELNVADALSYISIYLDDGQVIPFFRDLLRETT